MAKRKGMSAEEKRQTLLGIFHETKDVFTLKDIEKLGSKRGVVQQSIKDVLQSLVDDDMVHQEKIGASNYFWSFPGEAAAKVAAEIAKLERRLQERQAERAALETQLEASRVGKEDSEERRALQQQVAQLQAAVERQAGELAEYAGNDPDRYDNLKAGAKLCCDSANRWIDNIESLRSWMKKRFEGMHEGIDNMFKENNIKEEMDYLQLEKLP